MARIPLGDFGMRQPEVVHTRLQAPNGADLQAVQELAGTVQGLAQQQMQKDKQEQDKNDKAAALLAEARATNRKDALNLEASKRIEIGEDEETVKKDWSSQFSKIDEEEYGSVSPQYRGALTAQSERQKFLGLSGLEKAGSVFRKNRRAGDLDALGQEMMTSGVSNPAFTAERYAAIIDVTADGVLSDKQKEDAKQSFAKNIWIAHANQRILEAGDEQTLQGLHDELAKQDGEFSSIEPNARMTLQNQAYSRITHHRAMRNAEEQGRLVGASQNIAATMDLIKSGVQISPEDAIKANAQAEALKEKNPALYMQWKATESNMPAFAEMNAAPIPEQTKLADAMLANARKDHGQGAVWQATKLNQAEEMRRQADANRARFNADPYGYIEDKTGIKAPAIDFSLMASDRPEDKALLAQQFSERKKYANTGAALGGASPGLFNRQEVETITNAYDNGNLTVQKGIITSLASIQSDDRTLHRTIGEIGKKNPVLAQVVAFEKSGDKTSTGAPVADLVMRGANAVKTNKDIKLGGMDREAFSKQFLSESGIAMFADRDDLRGAALEAAENAYYGLKARAGDFKPELDSKKAEEAIRGVMGNPINFNGQPTPPPQGMNESVFQAKAKESLAKLWTDMTKAGAINLPSQADFVSDSKLQMMGDGGYRVLMENGGRYRVEFKGAPSGDLITYVHGVSGKVGK